MPDTNVPRRRIGRPPAPVMGRFMKFVRVLPNGCWEWTGRINLWGYGRFWHQGKEHQAHRMACRLFGKPIPDGLDGDHLCHNRDLLCGGGISCPHRRCVNPEHISPATEKENAARGFRSGESKKTHCPSGHPYDEANTFVYTKKSGGKQRMCRECNKLRSRRLQAGRLAARVSE